VQYNPIETYMQEAEDLLAEIEQSALLLVSGRQTDDTVHQLFRAFHTIKGSGAMCGLDAIAGFTHHVETLLDKVREGVVPASPSLAELVLKCKDHIRELLNAEQGAVPPSSASGEKLIAEVKAFSGAATPNESGKNAAPAIQHAERTESLQRSWLIQFRPHPTLFVNGGNPAALLNELAGLGECEITAHTEEIPDLEDIQPDLCYLWWTVRLRSACDENAIRDVFIFVEDDSKLEIGQEREDSGTTDSMSEPAPPCAPADRLAPTAGDPEPSAPPVSNAEASKAVAPKTLSKEATVRVPSNRLDRLVNLVGELVMNQSRLAQAATQSGAPEIVNPIQELERLVAELRDNVLGIRMLPIGTLFGRFRRLVHDLSMELGKEVDLVTEGAETEIDKSILDQLGDPLVHCLRNCLDHGVEQPAERLAQGKPRRAVVRLSAHHTGSDVVVSIQDDGRGIDRNAVRAKAEERGLIAASASLSDKDIFNLILLPGFSTARQVTSVSGRGVGMDAVKRQIDALRGSLSLASEPGKGTRLAITLPLTLAIIDGLRFQVGGDEFIVPMAAVTENVELLRAQRARNNGRNVIAVRGELIPYIDLRRTFHIEGDEPQIEKVVIVKYEDQRVGMVVDRVLGTHQTVLQSLGKFFRTIDVVSGATIMGDGTVALIIDVAAVVRHAERQNRAPSEAGRKVA